MVRTKQTVAAFAARKVAAKKVKKTKAKKASKDSSFAYMSRTARPHFTDIVDEILLFKKLNELSWKGLESRSASKRELYSRKFRELQNSKYY